ncbi:MAG: extracellular solute-binding protein [bacterium]|nr:extracellular solute-binding protein [bacterium]
MSRRLCLVALVLALAVGACRPGPPGEAPPIRFRPVPLDPNEEYAVRLWDFRYPVGPVLPYEEGGERYRESLQAVLDAFTASFPNVRVEVTLLDFEGGDQALLEALAAGDPPDVFASWWQYPRPDHELVVPVEPYLDPEEAAAYHPLAWQLAGAGAWPRWLFPLPILARTAALEGDPAGRWESGWEWADLLAQAAGAARRGTARYGLAAASGESALGWLLASQGAGLFGRGPELPRALGWVRQAVEGGALLTGKEADDQAVYLFASGRAAFLLGVNPALARRLLADPTVVALPVPRFAEAAAATPVGAAHLVVFRQRDFKGLEHTRAAVELARWLSRAGELFPGELLLGIPAWGATAGEVSARLLEAARGPNPGLYPGSRSSPEEFQAAQAARGPLARWWAGELTDGELEERLGMLLPVFAPRR